KFRFPSRYRSFARARGRSLTSYLNVGRWALAAPLHCEGELIASPARTVEGLLVSADFQIRLATVADLEVITWHRARMFEDMGELTPDLLESFRAQSFATLHRMLGRGEYVGWLASLENEIGRASCRERG